MLGGTGSRSNQRKVRGYGDDAMAARETGIRRLDLLADRRRRICESQRAQRRLIEDRAAQSRLVVRRDYVFGEITGEVPPGDEGNP